MSGVLSYSRQDPDYETVTDGPTFSRRKDEEQINREDTLLRIAGIIERQFDVELQLKEEEVILVDGKISQAMSMLDKLRAYLLANYYGHGGKRIKGNSKFTNKKLKRFMRDTAVSNGKESLLGANSDKFSIESYEKASFNKEGEQIKCTDHSKKSITTEYYKETESDHQEFNRFYAKKRIIVGNVSKFIPMDKRERNDQATHKWMVYVRSPPGEPVLDSFIQRIWFFLHPSYMPNDIIEIARPPFTVTRRGWGEFPVRIQVIFCDPKNKPVDIIHNLKLDKTYTGLQTLGSETTVEIELQRHSILTTEVDIKVPSLQLSTGGKQLIPQKSFLNEAPLGISSGDILLLPKIGNLNHVKDDRLLESYEPLNNELLNTKFFKDIFEDQSHLSNTKEVPTGKLISSLAIPAYQNNQSSFALPSLDHLQERMNLAFDEGTEHALSRNISNFPLILESRDISKLHYCAKSFNQYKCWSHSKRRASEWQRALDVKRALLESECAEEGLSTRQVMIWCRQHGYTPPEINTSVVDIESLDFCPCCGKSFLVSKTADENLNSPRSDWCSSCLSNRNFRHICSLTSFSSLVADFRIQDYKLSLLEKFPHNADDESENIDIIQCSNSKVTTHNDPLPFNVSTNCLSTLSMPEIDWIFEAAAQIEVHLPLISTDIGQIPLLQYMLLVAMKSFLKDILTRSHCFAKQNSTLNQPVVVTPIHVHQQLMLIPHLDFLSDCSLGIQEEDGNL